MSDIAFTAPHEHVGFPEDVHAGSMLIRQERAAVAAYAALQSRGARVGIVHRLPNGLGYVAPNTGHDHAPAGCTMRATHSGSWGWIVASRSDGRGSLFLPRWGSLDWIASHRLESGWVS